MNARPCGSHTPSGPCQHVVAPPDARCWQHRDQAAAGAVVVDTESPDNPPTIIWNYEGCAFVVLDRATRVECLNHSGEAWESAIALGGQPPCQPLREEFLSVLASGTDESMRVPRELLPMLAYARWQIPRGAINDQGAVLWAYLSGHPEVQWATLRKWGATNTKMDGEAVAWLKERGCDPQPWRELNEAIHPSTIVLLVQAGITASKVQQYRLAMPKLAGVPGFDVEIFKRLGPQALIDLVNAGIGPAQIAGFKWSGQIASDGIRAHQPLGTFAAAVVAGLTTQEFQQMKGVKTKYAEGVHITVLQRWMERHRGDPPGPRGRHG